MSTTTGNGRCDYRVTDRRRLDLRGAARQDDHRCCGLHWPNAVTGKRQGQCLLTAVLKIGWRIVASTPEELPLLEAHGLASGRVQ